MNKQALRADVLLFVAAVLWGIAFVAQRSAMQHMGPLTYNAARFLLGAVVLMVVVILRRPRGGAPAVLTKSQRLRIYWIGGVAAGMVLFAATGLQQAGLVYTTAGKGGFITGLYVPLVPVLGLLLGQRTRWTTWAGGLLAVGGLYLLSISGSLQLNPGDLLMLACAGVCAVHVLIIGWLSPRLDPFILGLVQCAIVAVASVVWVAATETITLPGLRAATWEIVYGGVASAGIAFTLQIVGQRHAPPGHAALVLSLEAVVAALAGYLVLGETFGPRQLVGAALILGGTLVSQVRRLMRAGA